MDIVNKLELHYYFDDESHSMDANIRNKCESELLAIIYEAANRLGIDIKIDSEAIREGGIKDLWKLLGNNSSQISAIVAIIALLLSRVPVSDSVNDKLKIKETKLSIQEKQLSIAKMERELQFGELHNDTVDAVVKSLDSNLKVITRKSNFYKELNNCHKVNKVGFSKLDANNSVSGKEEVVNRADFTKFVLHTDELPALVIDNAIIEIISPVLIEGKYKWKGIYNGEPISFSMIDNEYKFEVLTNRISFQHGASIECALKIYRKLDELGDVVLKSYSVETVLAKINGSNSVATPQGRRYIFNKMQAESQGKLFSISE